MVSDKQPLVLLHGLTASGGAWQDVIPVLSDHHEVYAPTLPGHRGGPLPRRRPATASDVVDWVQDYLDEQGLQRPHVAGHSLGGCLAIELARRGRAATVCALAPGGFWSPGDGLRAKTMSNVGRGSGAIRVLRPVLPLVLKSAAVRRVFFSFGATHGDRVSAARGVEIVDDFIGCTVAREIFSSDDQGIAPLDPVPCPITVAWSENDVLNSLAAYDRKARERIPQATFDVLRDVGHDPMMDDPALVARTILSVTSGQ